MILKGENPKNRGFFMKKILSLLLITTSFSIFATDEIVLRFSGKNTPHIISIHCKGTDVDHKVKIKKESDGAFIVNLYEHRGLYSCMIDKQTGLSSKIHWSGWIYHYFSSEDIFRLMGPVNLLWEGHFFEDGDKQISKLSVTAGHH